MPKPVRKITAVPERRVAFDTLIAALNVAGDIGTEVGRMARRAAEGALNAAARLSRAANDLVDPKRGTPLGPPPDSSDLPEAAEKKARRGQRPRRGSARGYRNPAKATAVRHPWTFPDVPSGI